MDLYTIRKEMNNGKRIEELPLRVAYYARVSTGKDAQLHSLSVQQEYFENKIRDNKNWTFAGAYIDEGISGKSVKNREHFLDMIKDGKMKKFDLIITKEISRFARNTLDSLQYTRELLNEGVGVFFENDHINTLEPDSEFKLTIMASIAQEEIRKMSDRLNFGFRQSIKKGVVLGNDVIWGYRKNEGRLEIVPEEAEMVKMIFDMYANKDMGIRRIAAAITDMGYRNNNGNPFSFSTIRGILVNPKYKGWYCGGKTHKVDYQSSEVKYLPQEEWTMYKDETQMAVPAIVSEELWDKANAKLKINSAKVVSDDRTSYQNKYPYSGKIYCGEHNVCYHHGVYRYKSGDKEYWACHEYGNGNKCRNPLVYQSEIDAVMKEVYNQIVCEKATIVSELIEIYKESGSDKTIRREKKKVNDEINKILDRQEKLLNIYMDGDITNSEFKMQKQRYGEQLDKLREKLEMLDEDEAKSAEMKKNIDNLREIITNELDFSGEMSKNVIDSLIDKIVVYKTDKKNEIDLKVYLKLIPTELSGHISRSKKNTSVCCEQYT